MTAPSLESWANFLAAATGAAATLSGLVFIALSINLARIVATPHLPGRAAETLVLLIGTVILCAIGLVPGESLPVLGAQYLVLGFLLWLTITVRHLRMRSPGQSARRAALVGALGQGASLPFIAAGASLMAGHAGGLYWLVPGVAFALVAGVLNAWVLLVEIVR